MTKPTLNSLFLSLFILIIATLGGTAITSKLGANGEAGSYFRFSALVAMAIMVCQSVIYTLSGNSVFLKILYRASMCLPIIWGFLCIILPVLWIHTIDVSIKYFLCLLFFYLSAGNFKYGTRLLHEKWEKDGEQRFEQLLMPRNNRIDWAEMSKFMAVPHDLYIPGVPQTWTPVVGTCLIISMLAGLNLRSIFPIFSIFAWGIPAIITTSFVFQLGGYIIMQAVKIKAIEAKRGIKIMSAS